jgi:hypothetical protein
MIDLKKGNVIDNVDSSFKPENVTITDNLSIQCSKSSCPVKREFYVYSSVL